MAQYVVKSGDTLSKIASMYGVDYRQITGYKSGDPNRIYVGEVVTIPDKGQVKSASTTAPVVTGTKATSTPTPTPAPAKTNTSTVQTSSSLPPSRIDPPNQSNLPITIDQSGYRYAKQYDVKTGQYYYTRMQSLTVQPTQSMGGAVLASAGGGGQQYPDPWSNQKTSTPSKSFSQISTPSQDIAKAASTPYDPNANIPLGNALSAADKQALEALKASKLNYGDYERQALDELTPWYEKLLAESNYDIDLALRHLEETYTLGQRQAKATTGEQLRMGEPTLQQERKSTLGNLAQRGLLEAAPITGPTETLSYNAPDTGEKLGGERIQGFGGLAGARMDILKKSQQSRVEAIQRALARQEEQSSLQKKQEQEIQERSRQKTARQLELEKQQKLPELAQSKYQRALQQLDIKRTEILSPYS